MTVQELFKSVNQKEFVQKYLENEGQTIELIFGDKYTLEEKIRRVSKFKEIVINSFEKMKAMEIKRDEEYICFAIPYAEDDAFGWDSFISKREEILNKDNIERVEKYAYELSPIEETLRYDVSETCIKSYGDLNVAVAIFDELTFCGVDIDARNERTEEIHEEINESLEEIKNTDIKSKTIKASDLFAELGWIDEREEFEKEFDMNRMKNDMEYFKKLYEMIINQEYVYITRK